MFSKYFTEFVGTFIFLAVILMSGGDAISIGVALAAVILFGGKVSGGHFNPAVSFMMYLKNSLPQEDLFFYVICQLAGAAAAFYYFTEASIPSQ